MKKGLSRKNRVNKPKAPSYLQLYKEQKEKDTYVICDICMGKMLVNSQLTDQIQGIKTTYAYVLKKCGHAFHNTCLKEYLINSSQFNQKINQDLQQVFDCPDEDCKYEINLHDVGTVLEKQDVEQWVSYIITQSFFVCKIKKCSLVIQYPKQSQGPINCTGCLHQYDAKTQEILLEGSSVEEINQLRDLGYIQCGRCKFFIEKTQGCNHMTCKCGFQSCYLCSMPYGKCKCYVK